MREAIEVLAAIWTYFPTFFAETSTKSKYPSQATPPTGKTILGCGGLALASSIRRTHRVLGVLNLKRDPAGNFWRILPYPEGSPPYLPGDRPETAEP